MLFWNEENSNKEGKSIMMKKRAALSAAVMLVMCMVSACGANNENAADGANGAGGEKVDSSANTADGGIGSAYISGIKVSDYVTLGEYKGIELVEEEPAVPEGYVEHYIDTYILAARATVTPVEDRTDVREGDTANIDYVGYRDGVAFDGGTAQGYDLTIGSGSFIPGFEDGLIGKNVGDTVTLDLTFPDDYVNAEMAGVSVSFEVTINSISIVEVPELTDELVQELDLEGCSTTEELNSYLNDYFYETAVNAYNQTVKNDITNAVMENCVFKEELPGELIERYYGILIEDMTETALSNGMDLNTYVKNYYNMDEETYTGIIRNNAGNMAKQYIMFKAIADAEGINMTEAEQDKAMEEWAAERGYESVDSLLKQMDEETFKEYLMAEEVVAFLLENATINTNGIE